MARRWQVPSCNSVGGGNNPTGKLLSTAHFRNIERAGIQQNETGNCVMIKHSSIFVATVVVLWALGVFVVYALTATGNGRFLEIVFTALFAGVPILAGMLLASYHNSKIGKKIGLKEVGLIMVLVIPVLVLVSGFLSPMLGRAMLGFTNLPNAEIFSILPESTIKIIVACAVGLLFFYRRVSANHQR